MKLRPISGKWGGLTWCQLSGQRAQAVRWVCISSQTLPGYTVAAAGKGDWAAAAEYYGKATQLAPQFSFAQVGCVAVLAAAFCLSRVVAVQLPCWGMLRAAHAPRRAPPSC